jgi:hypothetical protein
MLTFRSRSEFLELKLYNVSFAPPDACSTPPLTGETLANYRRRASFVLFGMTPAVSKRRAYL